MWIGAAVHVMARCHAWKKKKKKCDTPAYSWFDTRIFAIFVFQSWFFFSPINLIFTENISSGFFWQFLIFFLLCILDGFLISGLALIPHE